MSAVVVAASRSLNTRTHTRERERRRKHSSHLDAAAATTLVSERPAGIRRLQGAKLRAVSCCSCWLEARSEDWRRLCWGDGRRRERVRKTLQALCVGTANANRPQILAFTHREGRRWRSPGDAPAASSVGGGRWPTLPLCCATPAARPQPCSSAIGWAGSRLRAVQEQSALGVAC